MAGGYRHPHGSSIRPRRLCPQAATQRHRKDGVVQARATGPVALNAAAVAEKYPAPHRAIFQPDTAKVRSFVVISRRLLRPF